jgi:hypothetical protein
LAPAFERIKGISRPLTSHMIVETRKKRKEVFIEGVIKDKENKRP